MPDDCLTKRCFDCGSHAVVAGKLDCNYLNRLGLAQPTVKSFLDDMPSEKTTEELDAELKEMEERQKVIDERMAEIRKKREEVGGEKNGTTN